jgi:subtilisin family serine protease
MRAAVTHALAGTFAVALAATALTYPLKNDGAIGAPGADVNAESAWEITEGSRSVIVAVLDTGVDVTHPELAASIWTNPGEIPGNGLDDDNDGHVDDVHGWDFADDDADVSDAVNPHGTLVAGLITGTKTGLAPGVTLMPLKIFSDSFSDPNFEQVASDAILFALAHGAQIIQISWELSGPPGPVLSAAFGAAYTQGALVVVAAGNDGINLTIDPVYPAAVPLLNVIGVSGTDRYDRPVDLPGLFVTNFGVTWCELAAPTEKNPTTYPGGGSLLFTGTSAAAPLVSAAAALAWSANPQLTAIEVRDAIVLGAVRIPALDGKTLGAGRLDAGNTVRLAAGAALQVPRAVVGPVTEAAPGVSILFDGTQSFGGVIGGVQVLSYEWDFGDGARSASPSGLAEHAFFTGGDWPVTLRVTDLYGLDHVAHQTVRVPFRGASVAKAIESVHPYPGGTQQVVPITLPGAAWIRLHFSHIATPPGDAFLVFDGARTGLKSFQGTFDDVTTDPIRGESAFVYLRGFNGGTYGFTLDRVDYEMKEQAEHPPIARVGGPASVLVGEAVALSAAASTDEDGDALTYAWRIVQAPAGSIATPVTPDAMVTAFSPDLPGDYALVVAVSDGTSTSEALTWVVTRKRDNPGVNCDVTSPDRGAGAPRRDITLLLLPLAAALGNRVRRRRSLRNHRHVRRREEVDVGDREVLL